MNINKILSRLATISLIFALYSCADDNYYDMGGIDTKRVAFTAINRDLANEAESSIYRDYYDLPDRDITFPIKVFKNQIFNGEESVLGEYSINLRKESEIWSGGYNEIVITFIPSHSEEKEATFTMPDGSVYSVTSENPTIIWTPDSTMGQNAFSWVGESYIKAESRYTIGKTQYHNVGYVYVNFNTNLRFNKTVGKWFESYWANGDPLTAKSYVKFTAENLTVGSSDRGTSSNRLFPETEITRNDQFTIQYIGYDGGHRVYNKTLTKNDFLALGGSDIRFTFLPEEGQKEMILSLPDGQRITLTIDNPSYIWHVSREDINNYYYYSTIYGQSIYIKDGFNIEGEGEIEMMSMTEIWYDKETGRFRSDYWL
ncbi:MAG: hypothetical protein K2L45_02045 [Muribaculaceae bacterium]|nr:hypothetical protein [Muribaculaceae bacterium]MDE6631376.1 hypothetical protein [Muribaculaceae bacterium]